MGASPWLDTVLRHAQKHLPGYEARVVPPAERGIVRNVPDLVVVRLVAPDPGSPVVHVSAGAARDPLEEGYGIELYLLSREPRDEAAHLLERVAQLHADPRYPLSLGQVIEIGEPWLPGATCDHLLVNLPGPFAPEFEWHVDGERRVRFVWLVPLTAAEAQHARTHGLWAIQDRLAAARVDVAAVARPSVVDA